MISFSFWASDIFNTSRVIAVCGGLLIPMRLYFFSYYVYFIKSFSMSVECLLDTQCWGDNQDHYVIVLPLANVFVIIWRVPFFVILLKI